MAHLALQACSNGSRHRGEHIGVPVTVDAIGLAASSLGGLVQSIHVHAKNAVGLDSIAPDDVAATVAAVRRAAPEVEVGMTTGAWAEPDVSARIAAIREWTVLPDVASVNWHEAGAEAVAQALLDVGVGIEERPVQRGGQRTNQDLQLLGSLPCEPLLDDRCLVKANLEGDTPDARVLDKRLDEARACSVELSDEVG